MSCSSRNISRPRRETTTTPPTRSWRPPARARWPSPSPESSEGKPMATIPEIEARIHALWTKGEARTREESVELGRLLTALEAEMPPGDFYTHVLVDKAMREAGA